MHELACPSCNSPSQFDIRDYLLLCPFCSSAFRIDFESGQKEIYPDHYIVPNTLDARQVKALLIEWIRRLHHKPSSVEKEFFIVDIQGISIPFWVISLEAHTVWKGLVQKKRRSTLDYTPGSDYLLEKGIFRRSYRWAVSARTNLCETWGMLRLHEPKEHIKVEWDGFPLDSTFSRGRLTEEGPNRSAYDVREPFEFKFANGLPILGIQIEEEEALRRATHHVELYHYRLSGINADYLTDYRTEFEIAGIQLIHLPFWHARYIYKPRSFLRHFYASNEKSVTLNGYSNGILGGELPLIRKDKIWVNTIVCSVATMFFLLLGSAWHSAFFIVAFFCAIVAGASAYMTAKQKAKAEAEENENSDTKEETPDNPEELMV